MTVKIGDPDDPSPITFDVEPDENGYTAQIQFSDPLTATVRAEVNRAEAAAIIVELTNFLGGARA